MPEVRDKEKKSDYIGRCVSYVVKEEGLTQDAALGKCYGMYKQHLKNKRAKSELLTDEEKTELAKIDVEEVGDLLNKL